MSTSVEEPPGSSAASTGDREVVVERVFNAPRDAVWQAFTDPAMVAQWWGRGHKLVIEKLELWPGGRWRFVEHADDGVHGFEGLYREVTAPERLVWTFAWDGTAGHAVLDTVTFEDLGDGRTKVVSRSVFQTSQERDAMLGFGMQRGRDQSYAALDRLLAEAAGTGGAGQIGSTRHGGEDV
jgi:uncharacterized protein YndB with AHSA1/START domain